MGSYCLTVPWVPGGVSEADLERGPQGAMAIFISFPRQEGSVYSLL